MKHRLHKLFAAFLAVMMLVSCLSLTAFAGEGEEAGGTEETKGTEETEKTEKSTHTYELYQIFTGTYDETTFILSNIKWGLNGKVSVDGTEAKIGDLVSDTVLADLKSVSQSTSDSEKLTVIKRYVDLNSEPYKGESSQPVKEEKGNGLVYSNVDAGYYLIKDKENSQTGTGTNYTLYVVKATDGEILFEPKGSVPTVDKEVQNGESWGETNSASIGDDVSYRLTGSISSRIADYATYYYKFTDTLSKGLTYKTVYTQDNDKGTLYLLKDGTYTDVAPVTDDSVNDTSANYDSVTNKYVADTDANAQVYLVNGTDKQNVTKYFYVNAAAQSDGTTNLTVAIKDLKALLLLGTTEEVTQYKKDAEGNDTTETETVDVFTSYYTITGTTQIVVEYTAVLNEDAVTAPSSNDNTVNITYSNNPNSSGTATTTPPSDTPPTDEPTPEDGQPTGETVEEETKTYTTALVITKKNENNKILTGAKFTLTGNGVNIVIVTKDVFTKVTPQEEIDNGDEQENLEQADDGSESTTPVYYYKLADGSYTTKAPTDNTMDKYEEDASAYTKETVTEVMGVGKTSTAVTATVGDDGVVTFTGLGAGDYTLTETEPPTGYNTMTPVSFTISYKNGAFSSDRDDIVYDATDGEFDMTVIDKPGSTLPRTGGIGTTIFYVVGTILVLSAGILLITKKRMGREVR